MNVVQLMASPFFGGPERQVLGLARHLPASTKTTFLSFAERGLARPFLDRARDEGFDALELRSNWPRLFRAAGEVADFLRELDADILCTNGYKPDVIGWLAGRKAGVPVVAIAHGWTGVTWRVRLNEMVDRWVMRRVARVVGVSAAQSEKVHRAGVREDRLVTIPNAVDPSAFETPSPSGRGDLEALFVKTPRLIVAAAGRLSPEKGFDIFVEAARRVAEGREDVGFVLFGDGPLRDSLVAQVDEAGLGGRFVFAGFRKDIDRFLPHVDIQVLSSHTEGLPVIVLEAFASGTPVVSTAVGGVPEVLVDGVHGYLTPPGDSEALADRLALVLDDDSLRTAMGSSARARIHEGYSCDVQAQRFQSMFDELVGSKGAGASAPVREHVRSPEHQQEGANIADL